MKRSHVESQSSLGCSVRACVVLERVSVALAVRAESVQGAECPIPAQPAPTDFGSCFEQIPPKSMERFLSVRKSVH